MKKYLWITLFLSFVMLFLPFLSLNENIGKHTEEALTKESEKVIVEDEKATIETDLFDYIVGTVAAEMPASFETEALKAQAVASYTYKKYLSENGEDTISSNPEIHQGYKTKEELKSLWGDKYDFYIEKIENAVNSVYGEYLMVNGKTVPALYHALSPGVTESSSVVFGKDVTALKSVTAPGDKLSPNYINEKSFTEEELLSLLDGDIAEKEIKITDNTDSKFVKEIIIFGKKHSGTEIRTLLKLNSPFFTVEKKDESYVFTSYGKGHGVGMSQYSADYMARQGCSYKEILLHFYSGAEIEK